MTVPGVGMKDWGRWGAADERGALNLLGPESIRRGMAAVKRGEKVSLAMPIISGGGPVAGMRNPPQHFMTRDGGDYAAGLPEKPGFGFSDDYLLIACHGTTHIDALSHVWQDGLMWNGYSANEVSSRGAARCGIEKAGPIVTRGIFLDFVPANSDGLEPGYEIGLPELRRAVEGSGVTPKPGDALVIRTGWLNRWRNGTADNSRWPGLGADCAEWIGEQGIVLVGADNVAVECYPSSDPTCDVPLHIALMRDRGVHLLEMLDLEELAAAGVSEFLFVAAPLPIVGGVGSPIVPVAVF